MKKHGIVFIDRDIKAHGEVEKFLSEFNFISLNDYSKGVQLCKIAAPEVIVIGIKPKRDIEAMEAIRELKKEPSTRKVPIIGFYQHLDRIQIEKDHQEGTETYLVKPVNSNVMIAKINECINNAKAQKQYDIFKSKSHIKFEYLTLGTIKISFKSGLKYVLPEIKKVFNEDFMKNLMGKDCCLDIRDFPSVSKNEALVLEKIVSVFGKKRIAVIVGKHMGSIIAQSNLEDDADLYMNIDDYLAYLKKPRTNPRIKSIN